MGGAAEPGQPGENWRARNINSIKLRASDRKKHPVDVRHVDPLPQGEAEERFRVREQAQADAAARAEAAAAARRGAARERRRDSAVAERGHTPEGWVPANRRSDWVDPLSRRAADDAAARLTRQLGGVPERPVPRRKPKRVRRPGN